MKIKGYKPEAVAMMNAAEDVFRKQTGIDVLPIVQHPPCEVNELAWCHNLKQSSLDAGLVRVLAQVDIAGYWFVVFAFDNDSFWDVVVCDRDGNGWQAYPVNPGDAVQVWKPCDLTEVCPKVLLQMGSRMSQATYDAIPDWYAASQKQLMESKQISPEVKG